MGILAPLGRLLFSVLFIFSGINHFTQRQSLTGYAEGAGVPLPEPAVIASGVVLVAGGLAVLFGLLARLGAALLAGFLLLTALLVHDFWTYTEAQQVQQQQVHFLKNMSLAGAALFIVAVGPGPYSLRRPATAPRGRGAPVFRPRTQE